MCCCRRSSTAPTPWRRRPAPTQLLGKLGLCQRLDHRPSKLSGGEQQRVAVARALANRPPLVLADEPTGNLDEATADRVLGEFLALVRGEGSAALVATHNERLAAKMDRVVRLHDGVLAMTDLTDHSRQGRRRLDHRPVAAQGRGDADRQCRLEMRLHPAI